MFGIAGTAELSTFCPGTGTWNRLQDGREVRLEVAETPDGRVGASAIVRIYACRAVC